jgi:hypothetical protein
MPDAGQPAADASMPDDGSMPDADVESEGAASEGETSRSTKNRQAQHKKQKGRKKGDKRKQREQEEQRAQREQREQRKPEKRAHKVAAKHSFRPKLLLGPGFSLGAFYPGDVGTYVSDWRASHPGSEGIDLFPSFVPRLSLAFAPIPYLEIRTIFEAGWAPKYVEGNDAESRWFVVSRYSTGMDLVGHIPLSHGRRSLFMGTGLMFHALHFEDYAAYALGFRALMGFRFSTGRFDPEVVMTFDHVNGDTGRPVGGPGSRDLVLSYSALTIGANFYFDLLSR